MLTELTMLTWASLLISRWFAGLEAPEGGKKDLEFLKRSISDKRIHFKLTTILITMEICTGKREHLQNQKGKRESGAPTF